MAKCETYYRFKTVDGPQVAKHYDCNNCAEAHARQIRDGFARDNINNEQLLSVSVFVTVEVIAQFADTEGQVKG